MWRTASETPTPAELLRLTSSEFAGGNARDSNATHYRRRSCSSSTLLSCRPGIYFMSSSDDVTANTSVSKGSMRIREAKAILAEAISMYPVSPPAVTSRSKSDLSPNHNCGAVAHLMLMLRSCRDAAKLHAALDTLALLLMDSINCQSALHSDGVAALLETACHAGGGDPGLLFAVLTCLVALCKNSLDAKRVLWRHPSCRQLLDLIRRHRRSCDVQPAVLGAFLSLALCGDANSTAAAEGPTSSGISSCSAGGGGSSTATRVGPGPSACAAGMCGDGGSIATVGTRRNSSCNAVSAHGLNAATLTSPGAWYDGGNMCSSLIDGCTAVGCLMGANSSSDAAPNGHTQKCDGRSRHQRHGSSSSSQAGPVRGAHVTSSGHQWPHREPASRASHMLDGVGDLNVSFVPRAVQQVVASAAPARSLSSAHSSCSHLADRSSSGMQLQPSHWRRLLEPGLVLSASAALLHPRSSGGVLRAVLQFLTTAAEAPVPQHVAGWLQVLYCTVPLLQATSAPVVEGVLRLLQVLSVHTAFSRLIDAAGCVGPLLCILTANERGRPASSHRRSSQLGSGRPTSCSSSISSNDSRKCSDLSISVLSNMSAGGDTRERLCDVDCLAALVEALRVSTCTQTVQGLLAILERLAVHRPEPVSNALSHLRVSALLHCLRCSERDDDVAWLASCLLCRLTPPLPGAASTALMVPPVPITATLPMLPQTSEAGVAASSFSTAALRLPAAGTSYRTAGAAFDAPARLACAEGEEISGAQRLQHFVGAQAHMLDVQATGLTFPRLQPHDAGPISPRLGQAPLVTHGLAAGGRNVASQSNNSLSAWQRPAEYEAEDEWEVEHDAQWYSGGGGRDRLLDSERHGSSRQDSVRSLSAIVAATSSGGDADGDGTDDVFDSSLSPEPSREAWSPIAAPQLSHSSSLFGLDAMDTSSRSPERSSHPAPSRGGLSQSVSSHGALSHSSPSHGCVSHSPPLHSGPSLSPPSHGGLSHSSSSHAGTCSLTSSLTSTVLSSGGGGATVTAVLSSTSSSLGSNPPLLAAALPSLTLVHSLSPHLTSRFQQQYSRQHHEQFYWRQQQHRWQTLQQARGAVTAGGRPLPPPLQLAVAATPPRQPKVTTPVPCC